MKIKKSSLELLFAVAKGTDGILNFSESRARDSFIKPLLDLTQTYINDREAIYKAFCLKTEEGEPDLKEGNKYQFPPEKLDEVNKELQVLGDEEVEVKMTDNPQQIKGILDKSEYKPKLLEAEIIDSLLNTI